MLLHADEVLTMFAGLRAALHEDRKPTDAEALQTIVDGHRVLASIVGSLTQLALRTADIAEVQLNKE